MSKITVVVFFGGCSSEYSVSLESAYSVIRNLDGEKYTVLPVGISQAGKWYYYSGSLAKIPQDSWLEDPGCVPAMISPDRGTPTLLLLRGTEVERLPFDVAFPVLHGKNGEDGTIQGLLELAGIPVAGCGALSSALCMDKDRAHKLAELAGVAVPRSIKLTAPEQFPDALAFGRQEGYPLFVKPVRAGSSYGITRVESEDALLPAVELAFQHDREVILEQFIEGFEVGCAVMGREVLTVGEVDEIELSGGYFDFTEKYTLKTSAIYVPARIDGEIAARIKQTARVLYRAMDCDGFARVDMFLTPQGRIVFNEINTIPGFTEHSRFPGMMRAAGIPFSQILDTVIALALQA